MLRLLEELRGTGLKIGGVVSPPVFNDGDEKIGFQGEDILTGEQWDLGRSNGSLDGPRLGPWSFSNEGFRLGISAIRGAINSRVDLVVLDEIGPLELIRGEGYAEILPELTSAPVEILILVLRQNLIDLIVSQYFQNNQPEVVEVTRENRQILPYELVKKIMKNY
jgi:nucleoside-triphosphatase THEP1